MRLVEGRSKFKYNSNMSIKIVYISNNVQSATTQSWLYGITDDGIDYGIVR